MSRCVRCLWLMLGLMPFIAAGAEPWSHLAIGMSPEETLTLVGKPLVRSAGKGFELWIYDNHAEILFYGNVIGWSCPGALPISKRNAPDVWQANGGKDDFRAVLDLLPPPKPLSPLRNPAATAANGKAPTWRPKLRWAQ